MNLRSAIYVVPLAIGGFLCGATSLRSADCNRNGVDDTADITSQHFGFEGTSSYPVPGSLLTAVDIDGDSGLDLVSSAGSDITILLNPGDSILQKALSYPMRGHLQTLTVADFNGDSNSDIAAGGRYHELSVLINQGGGAFKAVVDYPIGGFEAAGLTAADLNGDGKPDLVVNNHDSDDYRGVSILLSKGDGTFVDAVIYPLPISLSGLIVGDLDGDDRPELITANSGSPQLDPPVPNRLSILFNQGDGSFKPTVMYPLGVKPGSVKLADLNGDGKSDLIGVKSGCFNCDPHVPDELCVHLSQGDGSFNEVVSYPLETSYPSSVAEAAWMIVADLNGDGKSDLATGGYKSIWVLPNQGDGGFGEFVRYPIETEYPVPLKPLVATDINGDGKTDIFAEVPFYGIAGFPSRIAVFLNRGGWSFDNGIEVGNLDSGFLVGDLNGDSLGDLIFQGVKVLWNRTRPPVSLDLNHNGIPDECETRFHRGDPNSSGDIDISDGIAIFGFLFLGDASPGCLESADANNDGAIDISDGIYLLEWLFTGGPELALPGPTGKPCGNDPDPAGSPGDLGCDFYAPCR